MLVDVSRFSSISKKRWFTRIGFMNRKEKPIPRSAVIIVVSEKKLVVMSRILSKFARVMQCFRDFLQHI